MTTKIHDFEEWVKRALRLGLKGPARLPGFDSHHFIDEAGNSAAVWNGAEGHGTVPGEPAPEPAPEPVPPGSPPEVPQAESEPTKFEETH